jgi:HPt (histidine-containing phosphotransfer) domain-containing protein
VAERPDQSGRGKGKKMLTKRQPKARQKSQSDSPAPAIFDRAHLHQYTAGDGTLERELIGLFLAQFDPIRAQLSAAASADDWKFAAHTIKGSARSIGAPQIAALAEEIEAIGHDGAKRKRKAKVLARLVRAMAAFAVEAEKVVG